MGGARTKPDFVKLARDAKPILRERNAKADADRVIPEETIRELQRAGFFRMLQPKRWGGYECNPIEFFDAAIEIVGACPSTAWVLGVVAVHNWQLALFPEHAQRDVWEGEKGVDTLIASLTRVIGLERGEAPYQDLVPYRMDERAARILLRRGAADDLGALGFEVPSEQALREVAAHVREAGYPVEPAGAKEAKARGVAGFVRTFEPGGVAIELFHGPVVADAPFGRQVVAADFVTGEQGIGHLALRANNIAATRSYFEQVLRFTLSDYIRCAPAGDFEVDITFLHVFPRHHTVALGAGLPKHLHHFMLQMGSLDDVGAALDRAFASEVRIVQGLGRHPNERMVSFYCVTPSGFECEVGWGGRTIDDGTWEPAAYNRISEWGHQSPYRQPPKRQTEMGEQP